MPVAARPVVLAAVRDAEWRTHIQSKLNACSTLAFVDHARNLSAAASERAPDVTLWHLDDLSDPVAAYAEAFWKLRRIAHRTVILAYGQMDRTTARLFFVAGRVGVDRVLLRGFDDLEVEVRGAIRSTAVEGAIRRMLGVLAIPAGPAVFALAQCLRAARTGPMTVQQLASDLNVNRKTVSTWLRSAGLCAPERLISWCRVYWAADLLRDDRRSIAEVARILRFSSESDLRRMVSRHAQCAPMRLRSVDGVDAVVAAFPRVRAPDEEQTPHSSTGTPH
jgi:AraC-like DNA-binding protein